MRGVCGEKLVCLCAVKVCAVRVYAGKTLCVVLSSEYAVKTSVFVCSEGVCAVRGVCGKNFVCRPVIRICGEN